MHGATSEELAESVAIVGQTTFWSNVLHAQNYGINPINLRKNSKQLGNTYQKSDDDNNDVVFQRQKRRRPFVFLIVVMSFY
jgi:hypothetical protein